MVGYDLAQEGVRLMGKLEDAIRDRRKTRQRRLGFGAAPGEQGPSILVGSLGAVEGADFFVLHEGDEDSVEVEEGQLWGMRIAAATLDRVTAAREAGAAFAAIWLEYSRAEALLDDQMDYVIRVPHTRLEDSDARALAGLRPTLVSPNVEFPLRMRGLLELRRMGLLTGSALGATVPPDISAQDLELLRDSGVVSVLIEQANAEEIAAVKARVAGLPEHKTPRDEDLQPILPTSRPGGADYGA